MYRIGVDLGGTNIAVGLVDENYKIVSKVGAPTDAGREPNAIVADIAMLCRRVCSERQIEITDVAAVGVASPGVVDRETGTVVYANNLHFRMFPLAERLRDLLGVEDISIENDANAAAWGEAVAGAARGTSNSVMITLGTGVGGGIIIDRKIYSGFNGAGAELGHIVIEHDGRPCTCGRRGCWETYSSATALINMTKEKLDEYAAAGKKTVMTDLVRTKGKISGLTAFDAMRSGDEAGREIVNVYLDYLACGIANIVNIFQPEVISLGGGVSNEGASLIAALLPQIEKERYGDDVFFPQTEIRIAQLGNDAGIIGSALLTL